MSDWSIQKKVNGVIAILFIVTVISGFFISDKLDNAAEETKTYDALGRQRMLSQAMGKASLGFAMA